MRRRRLFVERIIEISFDGLPPARSSQNHFDLIKSGIVDGVSSSTGLYDSEPGDVPDIFNPSIDKFSLADALMRRGASQRDVQKVASSANVDTSQSSTE